MRTAHKSLLLNTQLIAVAAILVAFSPAFGMAQTASPQDAPATETTIAGQAPPAAQPALATPPTNTVDPTIAAAAVPAKDEKKGLAGAEDKVSDSVKALSKRLSATENVTLDDLNSARQAVAKIEALIDIEKHLRELEKLRSDRDDSSARSISNSLPASALSPFNSQAQIASALPLPMPSPVAMPNNFPQNGMNSFGDVTVSRITGSDGRFTAAVKTADGQTKNVQVGDKLNGGTVSAITSSGVTVDQNKTIKVFKVKNVQTVFGDTP